MAKNRNTFRQHIRAARDWLGRAENSMDKKNDVRGDLNLMLAQAELQRARETKGLTKRASWLVRLAPLAAALLLVAGCLSFLRLTGPQARQVAEPNPPAVQRNVEPAEPKAVLANAETAAPKAVSRPVAEPPAARPVSEPAAAVAPVSHAKAAPRPVEQPAARVPSADMQKLMQSAGRSLRAQ